MNYQCTQAVHVHILVLDFYNSAKHGLSSVFHYLSIISNISTGSFARFVGEACPIIFPPTPFPLLDVGESHETRWTHEALGFLFHPRCPRRDLVNFLLIPSPP